MNWILWIFGLVGHAGIGATIFNQIHATACPRNSRKLSEKFVFLIVFAPILLVILAILPLDRLWGSNPVAERLPAEASWVYRFGVAYAILCVLIGVLFTARWIYRKLTQRTPAAVLQIHGQLRNLKQELRIESGSSLLHGGLAKALGMVPFNQILLTEVKQLELRLDIDAQFEGLRICQLSDLHFTGHIDKRFFQRIVAIANAFRPHLTLITGDLLDKDRCIEWIPETLGRLQAELGCYFVLGNHDLLVLDQQGYLNRMQEAGLQRVHQDWTQIPFGDAMINLAGNELPWYAGAERLPELPARQANEFRLLMTHSPDQVQWARRFGFDLILAGHNHGGQIRFPWIGAVIVPSRYGVKYASGTFEVDRSILHVSRGISGDEPIRINCPPEIGLITIRSSRRT